MHLENRIVGRKTPLDGKLEIERDTAEQLGPLGVLTVQLAGELINGSPASVAHLTSMQCTCAKGPLGASHIHQFLECELFRHLPVNAVVALELDHPNLIRVRRATETET